MESKDLILLAVTLLILGEVTYLLTRLPRNSIKTKSRAVLVDTSVLMDGRIVPVAKTGFIGGTLVVPRSVVGELQFLADHADSEKRMRARHGLDVVSELQQMKGVDVEILQDGNSAREGVDNRLLTLAKENGAVVMTLDYNLNKVAVVEGVEVLNLNELAQSIRMEHLPGEKISVDLIQKGQDSHQGVGYLSDGTMVVVEQASAQIGQTLEVEIIRNLQTAAGRMIFAKKIDASEKVSAKSVAKRVSGRAPRKISADSVVAKSTAKTSARKSAAKTASAKNQKSAANEKSEKVEKTPRRQTRPRKRANHEEDLINLVNDQAD